MTESYLSTDGKNTNYDYLNSSSTVAYKTFPKDIIGEIKNAYSITNSSLTETNPVKKSVLLNETTESNFLSNSTNEVAISLFNDTKGTSTDRTIAHLNVTKKSTDSTSTIIIIHNITESDLTVGEENFNVTNIEHPDSSNSITNKTVPKNIAGDIEYNISTTKSSLKHTIPVKISISSKETLENNQLSNSTIEGIVSLVNDAIGITTDWTIANYSNDTTNSTDKILSNTISNMAENNRSIDGENDIRVNFDYSNSSDSYTYKTFPKDIKVEIKDSFSIKNSSFAETNRVETSVSLSETESIFISNSTNEVPVSLYNDTIEITTNRTISDDLNVTSKSTDNISTTFTIYSITEDYLSIGKEYYKVTDIGRPDFSSSITNKTFPKITTGDIKHNTLTTEVSLTTIPVKISVLSNETSENNQLSNFIIEDIVSLDNDARETTTNWTIAGYSNGTTNSSDYISSITIYNITEAYLLIYEKNDTVVNFNYSNEDIILKIEDSVSITNSSFTETNPIEINASLNETESNFISNSTNEVPVSLSNDTTETTTDWTISYEINATTKSTDNISAVFTIQNITEVDLSVIGENDTITTVYYSDFSIRITNKTFSENTSEDILHRISSTNSLLTQTSPYKTSVSLDETSESNLFSNFTKEVTVSSFNGTIRETTDWRINANYLNVTKSTDNDTVAALNNVTEADTVKDGCSEPCSTNCVPNEECLSSKVKTSTTPAPKLCHRNDFLPLPNCNKYLNCSSDVPEEIECPTYLHFNPSTRVCDWSYKAGCGSAVKQLSKPSDLLKCPCKTCLIPSATSCSHYYLCLDFIAYEMKCSDALNFDTRRNTCNFIPLVDCNDLSLSSTPTEIKSTESPSNIFTSEFNPSISSVSEFNPSISSISEFDPSISSISEFAPTMSSISKFELSMSSKSEIDPSMLSKSKFYHSTSEMSQFRPTKSSEFSTLTVKNSRTTPVFTCPNREGVFRYPGNCGVFYNCVNWYPYVMHCPLEKHFSEISEHCIAPCDAKCDLTLDCKSQPSTSTTFPIDSRCSCMNCTLPSPETCSKFILCINGRARIRNCPRGQNFDSDKLGCYRADTIVCRHSALCPKLNGSFPYKDDSQKYVKCINGVHFVKKCPPNLEFDTDSKRCQWPNDLPVEKNQDSIKKEKQRKIWRCPLPFGYFSHDEYCNKFYQCNDGTPILKECSSGLSYNPKYQTCDWKKKVRCNSNRYRKPKRCRNFDNYPVCSEDRKSLPHAQCSMYYYCMEGKACTKACPSGLYFNNMTGVCDFANNVKCY